MKKQQKPTGIQKLNEEQSSAEGWLWLHKQQELGVILLWKQKGGNQDSKKTWRYYILLMGNSKVSWSGQYGMM